MEFTVEEAKNLLTNTEIINRFIIESDYTPSDDPKYPTSFWKIKKFNYRIDMDILKKPQTNDWEIIQSFQAKTLEEAIAHCILGTQSDKKFESCPLPEHLIKNWLKQRFVIEETISSKIKWEEKRINRNVCYQLYDILDDKEMQSYSGSRWKIDYLLSELPSLLTKLGEGMPFGFSTPDILKLDPIKRFPWFTYENKLYESTHYIHDQKCICGNLAGYSGSYDEKYNIKVEIWSVQKFYQKDEVYIDGDKMFYNGVVKPFVKNYSTYIDNETKQNIKSIFPRAKRYNCEMESGNL